MPLATWKSADGTVLGSKKCKAPKRPEQLNHWFREAIRALKPKEVKPEAKVWHKEHVITEDFILFKLVDDSVIHIDRRVGYIG